MFKPKKRASAFIAASTILLLAAGTVSASATTPTLSAAVTTNVASANSVFGPDGTHYPSNTPDLRSDTSQYHIVNVAASGTAIRTALNNLTAAQIDKGVIIKVAPGALEDISAINGYKNTRDNKVLITARDGYQTVTSNTSWTFEDVEGISVMRFAAKSLDVRGAVNSSFGWMTLSFNYLGAVAPDANSPVDGLEFIEIVQPSANVKSSDSGQTKAYTGKVVKDVVYEGVYLAPSYYVDAVYNTPTTPDRPHTDTLQIEGVGIEAPGVKITDSVFFGSNNTALIIGGVGNIDFDHSLIVGAGKQTLRYPYLAGGAGFPGAINGEGSKGAIQGTGGGNIDASDSIFIGSLSPVWDEVTNTKVSVQNKVAATGSFTYDSSLMSWDVNDLNAASPVPTASYLSSIWNEFGGTPTTPVVDTTAPVVSITSPTTGSTVNNSVTLTASATDNVAVTKVSFWSGTTKLGDATKQANGSWASTVNTTAYPAGNYPVTAKAEDAVGNVKTSTAINLTISHTAPPTPTPTPTPVVDTTAPNVSITSPTTGTTVGNSVTLTATATDNVAVTAVSFWSGATKLGDAVKQTNGTWRLVASTTAYPNGTYPITAKAQDAAGNIKTSTAINVRIS